MGAHRSSPLQTLREASAAAATAWTTPGRPAFEQRLLDEWDAGLVTVTASAFALEALYGSMRDLPIAKGQTKKKMSAPARVLQTFRLSFRFHGDPKTWDDDFSWLFDLRGGAVHFTEADSQVVRHPTGTHVSMEQAKFSLETCDRAIRLLARVLGACADGPKAVTKQWTFDNRPQLEELRRLATTLAPPR